MKEAGGLDFFVGYSKIFLIEASEKGTPAKLFK